jgi:hypothetical protein
VATKNATPIVTAPAKVPLWGRTGTWSHRPFTYATSPAVIPKAAARKSTSRQWRAHHAQAVERVCTPQRLPEVGDLVHRPYRQFCAANLWPPCREQRVRSTQISVDEVAHGWVSGQQPKTVHHG